jgi:hypothetical protein
MFVFIVLNKINNIPVIIIPKILTYEQIIMDEIDHMIPFVLLSDSIYRDTEKDSAEITCNTISDDLFR